MAIPTPKKIAYRRVRGALQRIALERAASTSPTRDAVTAAVDNWAPADSFASEIARYREGRRTLSGCLIEHVPQVIFNLSQWDQPDNWDRT